MMQLTIEERLAKLEKSSRRWQMAFMSLLGIIMIAGAAQKSRPPIEEKIKARKLVILDSNDKERIRLGTDSTGTAELVVLGADGITESSIRVRDRSVVSYSTSGNKNDSPIAVSWISEDTSGRGSANLFLTQGAGPFDLSLFAAANRWGLEINPQNAGSSANVVVTKSGSTQKPTPHTIKRTKNGTIEIK